MQMSWIPEPVERLLEVALVGELTVVDGHGRPVTYPLIPLYDGTSIYLTSSALFSRKLEHIRANPKVSLSITDPVAVGGESDRATIQGDARVIEDDPHGGWERLLPIWEAKEPAIVAFLKERVALPLFFERALIEITPRRVLYWPGGMTARSRGSARSEGRPPDAPDTGAQPRRRTREAGHLSLRRADVGRAERLSGQRGGRRHRGPGRRHRRPSNGRPAWRSRWTARYRSPARTSARSPATATTSGGM